VKKQERNNFFNNKDRKYAKMCTRGMLLLSINTTTGLLVFVKFPEKLFPQVPLSRPIPTSEQIQAFTPRPFFEQIRAFTPSPSFEQMPAVELIPISKEVTASTPVPASKQIPAFELITVFTPATFFTPIQSSNYSQPLKKFQLKFSTQQTKRNQNQPGGVYRKMSRISG
jgi:hypothetical protein